MEDQASWNVRKHPRQTPCHNLASRFAAREFRLRAKAEYRCQKPRHDRRSVKMREDVSSEREVGIFLVILANDIAMNSVA